MKRTLCAAALALFAPLFAFAALPSAERLLPADTLGFITVPDATVAQSNFNRSPFGQFLSDPAMKPFTGKLLANLNMEKLGPFEKQLDIKLTNYVELARGQVTIALLRGGWDGSPDKKPVFAWLIDTRDKASQAQTNLADLRKRWIDKGNKMRVDKVRDVEFTTFIVPPETSEPASPDAPAPKPTELLVGQSGTLLVLSDSPKDVEKILALQAVSSVPALGDQASYAASAPLARNAGAFLWVDTKTIVGILARRAQAEQEPQQPSMFGAPPTLDKVLASLGIGEVQTIGANLMQTDEGSIAQVSINVPEAGRRGLLKMLAVDQKDSSPPAFVPADAVKFSRWRIDLQKAWTGIEAMLNEISPASGGVLKLLLDTAGKERDPNFNLRKVLLENLGDDVVSYEKAPRPGDAPGKAPSLVLIGSKNADQLAASLKALTSIIPPSMSKYEEREFLGRKVCSFSWPSMAGGKSTPVNYTASGGYVAISSDLSLVEEYLRSNEGKHKQLRETPGLVEAAQRVGGMNTGFFAYENQREAMRASFEQAKKDPSAFLALPDITKAATGPLAKTEKGSSNTNLIDPALLPPFDRVSNYFHMTVSAVNVGPGAISFKLFTPTPPAMKK